VVCHEPLQDRGQFRCQVTGDRGHTVIALSADGDTAEAGPVIVGVGFVDSGDAREERT